MESRGGRAAVFALCALAVAAVSIASLVGILTDDGGQPYGVTSVRGQAVDIYGGQGLYRYDSVGKAVAFRGFDWASLLVCVPLCALGAILYGRGRLHGRLLLTGVFTYFAYLYLIGVMGNAFNAMFLGWTAVFSAGAFGLAVVLLRIDVPALPERMGASFPRRSLAAYLAALAILLLGLYLTQVILAYATGQPPAPLEIYTTLELAALELGLMVPLHVVGAVLLWRRNAWGYVIAIALAVTAAITFIALSIGQAILYLSFHRGGIAGVLVPVVIAAIAACLSLVALRHAKG